MQIVDTAHVSQIIRLVAQEVILPRYCNLASGQVREKKPGDLVTVADTEAERLLTQRLTELLPNSQVVGEEAVAADDSILDRLERPGAVWVIDPVDGTSNFAQGRPTFCVIIALVLDGVTVQGWIHDPLPNHTTTAVLGQGAWKEGRRLTIADNTPLEKMTGSVGIRKNERLNHVVAHMMRQGSAGHDYLALTDGRLHFASFRRLRPWDHAAGVLLHQEAGGYSALLDGSPYRPVYNSEATLLMAPSRQSWTSLRTFF